MIPLVERYIIPAALAVLPPAMDTREARAMLLAIGLQESRFLERRQLPRTPGGEPGPARGFWQFERGGGVRAVCTHKASKGPLVEALRVLSYELSIGHTVKLHTAIEHNDVLACVFARLLLWTLPARLPRANEPDAGWRQYLDGWRPGAPHPGTWGAFYREAWARVTVGEIEGSV